jgi:hypothetical protein
MATPGIRRPDDHRLVAGHLVDPIVFSQPENLPVEACDQASACH